MRNGEMRIANSNMHYFYYSWEYFAGVQINLGNNNVELYGATPHLWIDHYDFNDCRNILPGLLDTDIKLVAFTPKPYNYCFAAVDEAHRSVTLNYYKNCIRAAKSLGVKLMNISPAGGCRDFDIGKLSERFRDTLRELCKYSEDYGVSIALGTETAEQSPLLNTGHQLVEMKDQIDCCNLKVLVNTGVLNRCGETVKEWFEIFGSDIAYVHLVDNPPLQNIRDILDAGYEGYTGLWTTDEDLWYAPAEADRLRLKELEGLLERADAG